MRRPGAILGVTVVLATAVAWSAPRPAAASPGGVICSFTGLVSGALGKVCTVAIHAGKVIGAGRKLLGGHLGAAVGELTGSGGSAVRKATAAVGLVAIAGAVVVGAGYLLRHTAQVIGTTTRPDLTSTWFSASYWRLAAISILLTVPFLLGAAVQAILRSDLGLLLRAAFGYLPLAMLAIGIAAPLTALLLSASDEMSALVASASGHADADFLGRAAGLSAVLSLSGGTVFVSFFVALLTAAATISLWVELIVRDAAVDVIVLMLPLVFAAMAWPARRIWAIRAVELLVALILSKFVIVAVLTLGGAALGHTLVPGPASVLTGATLVMLAAFSPWALMRLLPLQELAGAAASGLSPARELPSVGRRADAGTDAAEQVRTIQARLPGPVGEQVAGSDWVSDPVGDRVIAGGASAEAADPETGPADPEPAAADATPAAPSSAAPGPAPAPAGAPPDDRGPLPAVFGPGEWGDPEIESPGFASPEEPTR